MSYDITLQREVNDLRQIIEMLHKENNQLRELITVKDNAINSIERDLMLTQLQQKREMALRERFPTVKEAWDQYQIALKITG